MSLIESLQKKDSVTNNGAITHSTSGKRLLDMFFLAGASRNMSEKDIEQLFAHAYDEDKVIAYAILLWSRHPRGGAGEKRFFQIIARYVKKQFPAEYFNLMKLMPEYGYYKDIFKTADISEDVLKYLFNELLDSEHSNLLAKYFPRKGPWFVAMHKFLRKTPKEFRKQLVTLTTVVEQKMCANKWGNIDYSQVPSVAMKMYGSAFATHDHSRFDSYIKSVNKGEQKINASVLFPSDIVVESRLGIMSNERATATWNALPDYTNESNESVLTIVDVSGSMSVNVGGRTRAIDVSIGLGLYLSEKINGPFKNHVITFSAKPRLVAIPGSNHSFNTRYNAIHSIPAGYNTNLVAVFNLILETAVKYNIKKSEMPSKILIISDMEFDGTGAYMSYMQNDSKIAFKTNYEVIKKSYKKAGYKMPHLVFWNVNGRLRNVPVQADTPNTSLVSGFSPSILKSMLSGKTVSAAEQMWATIQPYVESSKKVTT